MKKEQLTEEFNFLISKEEKTLLDNLPTYLVCGLNVKLHKVFQEYLIEKTANQINKTNNESKKE